LRTQTEEADSANEEKVKIIVTQRDSRIFFILSPIEIFFT
jgi:hypothetical protein